MSTPLTCWYTGPVNNFSSSPPDITYPNLPLNTAPKEPDNWYQHQVSTLKKLGSSMEKTENKQFVNFEEARKDRSEIVEICGIRFYLISTEDAEEWITPDN